MGTPRAGPLWKNLTLACQQGTVPDISCKLAVWDKNRVVLGSVVALHEAVWPLWAQVLGFRGQVPGREGRRQVNSSSFTQGLPFEHKENIG